MGWVTTYGDWGYVMYTAFWLFVFVTFFFMFYSNIAKPLAKEKEHLHREITKQIMLQKAVMMALNGNIEQGHELEHIRSEFMAAQDEKLCLDDCKGMYFCRKELGHEGKHEEDGLKW